MPWHFIIEIGVSLSMNIIHALLMLKMPFIMQTNFTN